MTEILFKYKFAKINTLCQLGSTIMYYKDQLIEKKLKSYNPIYINFGSTRMLIINETQPDLVSSLGNALCKQYDIPVCLYNISGSYDGVISVALSFRSIDHLEPVDSVARLFSGGGHRNASGCSVSIDKFNELLCQF
jgi:oligoribonuclease NrnB/cAMP/cGMP phosphodiesterase (DHH superfamily)